MLGCLRVRASTESLGGLVGWLKVRASMGALGGVGWCVGGVGGFVGRPRVRSTARVGCKIGASFLLYVGVLRESEGS